MSFGMNINEMCDIPTSFNSISDLGVFRWRGGRNGCSWADFVKNVSGR